FAVAFVVVSVGLSLGTPTGYAINPVRDLGPRLMYAFILPIRGKGSANWGYAWVPIVAPLLAAVAIGFPFHGFGLNTHLTAFRSRIRCCFGRPFPGYPNRLRHQPGP
ncbi:aquaporin, partial [Bacteroides fragilis]|nr:aquaporin [Bacteroides fragilis]